jgi:hypothetical protein
VFLTSVLVGNDSVYVGGYAMPGSAGLVQELGGVFPTAEKANAAPVPWPLPGDPVRAREPPVPEGEERVLTVLTRAHGDKGGVPCVLRFDAALSKLAGGTYLEGSHYAWNINQQLKEDEWTATPLGLLSDGSLIVGHDGGVPGHYYYEPDYVSRLAPDLTRRVWRFDLFFPYTSIERIAKYQAKYEPRAAEWRVPIFGQARILGLRIGAKDTIYVCGWSVSATSNEPWWVPFLFKLNPNGDVAWRAYSFDPMSGKGDRVSGDVADSVVRNVALTEEGDVLLAGLADGGNTVLRKNPLNYDLAPQAPLKGETGRPARGGGGERYKGFTWRMTDRLESKGGVYFGAAVRGMGGARPAWAVDLCALPGKRVLCLGRHNYEYPTSANAWVTDNTTPGGFLRLFDENYKDLFLTNLPDVTPYSLAVQGARVAVVGLARSGKALTKDALFPQQAGQMDAYLLIGEFPAPAAVEEKP